MSSKESVNPKIKRVLWGTDFSKESRFCLPYIKCFSQDIKTKNHALYVLPKFSDWVYEAAFFTDDDLFNTIERTRKKSITKINNYSKKSGVPLEVNVVEGLASEVLIDYAHQNKIDMIFAGRRGISEIEQILIGSTTSRLIRNTDIPVFVVPRAKREVKIRSVLCPIDFQQLCNA